MVFGRTPLLEVRAFAEEQIAWAKERNLPAVEADALLVGPYVDSRLGDFELARERLARSKEICRDLGIAYGLAEAGMAGGELELTAGDLPAAERELREAIDVAVGMGAAHYMALYRVRLARVLNEQGRHDEAGEVLDQAAELYAHTAPWKSNRARVLAANGALDEAVALAREAAELEEANDDLNAAALTLVDVSEVLRAAGDDAGAEAALMRAIALNEEKGSVVPAQQCRERLRR